MFETLSYAAVALAVFLVPIFLLPFTQNVLAHPKQVLVIVLAFLGLFAWCARTMSRGELEFRSTVLFFPVVGFLLAVGVSTLLSVWPAASFWGWPLHITASFLSVLGFSVLFFLMLQVVRTSSHLFQTLFLLVFSGFIASLLTVLHLFGIFPLPFEFAKDASFTLIGTVNSVAVLAAVLLPLSLVLAFVARRLLQGILWVVGAVLFLTVALINFSTAWIILLAGMTVFFVFGVWSMKKKQESKWVTLPMFFMIISLFFIFFPIGIPGSRPVPVEISPSFRGSLDIMKGSYGESPVLGSGPGTFSLQYAKYRSLQLNETDFWATRFSSGASEVSDWVTTTGLVGGIAFLMLLFFPVVVGVRRLVLLPVEGGKEEEGGEFGAGFSWIAGLGILASLVALVVGFFLYPASFVLWFVFWVLAAGIGIVAGGGMRRVSLAPPSFLALGSSFGFLLIVVFGLGIIFMTTQRYIADAIYFQGARASFEGNQELAIGKIGTALELNSGADMYWRDLAQLSLSQLEKALQQDDLEEEQRQEVTNLFVQQAIGATQRAVQIAPANVANWTVRGFVYRNLIGAAGDPADVAISSYERASELEPFSPFYMAEIARVYVAKSQIEKDASLSQEALNMALEYLDRSVELKADYSPARYLMALIYEEQGRGEEAIAQLETIEEMHPQDAGLAFQVGVIYWQREDLGRARSAFERAKSINPSYANARYMLGLVYDKQGEPSLSAKEFEAVLQMNPDNTDVQKILENIQGGKPALEGITPGAPPISDSPQEIIGEEVNLDIEETE